MSLPGHYKPYSAGSSGFYPSHSMDTMSQFTLRQARPEELTSLIDIDDAASELYGSAGIRFELGEHHPFVVDECNRWADSISRGLAYLALDLDERPVGFITLGRVDEQNYLDQLSVRPDSMRQGLGTRLLEQAVSWSEDRPLWLTTYSHIAWNRPYYEKRGFSCVPETLCGPQLRAILEKQRATLPAPEQRIAMVRYAR